MHLCSEEIFLLNVAVLFMIGYPCSATFSLIMLSSRKLLHLPRKIIPCLYVQLLLLVYAIETINFFFLSSLKDCTPCVCSKFNYTIRNFENYSNLFGL